MKQIFQNPKTGKTSIEDVPVPALKKGGVLVRTHFSLISPGTERGIIELSKKSLLEKAKERPDYVKKFIMLAKTKGIMEAWKVAQSKLATDIALGYSTSGEVIGVGSEAEEFQSGDRVACAGQNYASHAEFVYVPKNLCVKIPEKVTSEEASFGTLAAIAMQGIRQARLEPGESVAVIGLGLLGQLATRMLKAYGHPVIGFDIDANKVEYAKNKSGLDKGVVLGEPALVGESVRAFTAGRGVDAALVYASAKTDEPLKLAVEVGRDRGRVVQIGNIVTNIPWRDFYAKEMEYRASRSYGPGRYDPQYEEGGKDYPIGHVRFTERRNIEEFLRLLETGKMEVKDLISESWPIERAGEAYEAVFESGKTLFGLLLSYDKNNEPKDIFRVSTTQESVKADEVVIGLIGAGAFAQSTILPHLKKLNDKKVRLMGIASTGGKKAADIAKAWGAEYITSDYKRLLDDPRINLIIGATRHSNHAKLAQEILAADKNLYLEKPAGLNLAELKQILTAAGKSKGRLTIGFNRRYSQHFKLIKEELKNSPTPTMIMYRVNYPFDQKDHWSYDTAEGGRIIGEDCHFIDAFNFLTGSKPLRVTTQIMPIKGGVEKEENTVITVEYEDGSIGTLFYSALGSYQLPKEYMEVYGGGKTIVVDNFKNGKLLTQTKVKKINLRHQDKGYDGNLEAIIASIRGGKPSPMTLEEIWYAHAGIFAAYESGKDREAKEIPSIDKESLGDKLIN